MFTKQITGIKIVWEEERPQLLSNNDQTVMQLNEYINEWVGEWINEWMKEGFYQIYEIFLKIFM